MTDISNASRGVQLALLEGQLLSRQIDRQVFLEGTTRLGLSMPDADAAASPRQECKRTPRWYRWSRRCRPQAPPSRLSRTTAR